MKTKRTVPAVAVIACIVLLISGCEDVNHHHDYYPPPVPSGVYTITGDGRLMRNAGLGLRKLERDVESPIHGDIRIYAGDPESERGLIEYTVRFTHGRVEWIRPYTEPREIVDVVHAVEDVPYGAVLAGCIPPLEDDEQRVLALGIHEVLQFAKSLGERCELALGLPNTAICQQLMSACVAHCDRSVAWLSLDRRDNDPARFWAYIIMALQTICPGLGQAALERWQQTQSPPGERIFTELLNELAALPTPAVLVLDDFHVIDAEPVHEGLIFFLTHLPPSLHLVVCGRADPPWPLARLRARRAMVELRTPDRNYGRHLDQQYAIGVAVRQGLRGPPPRSGSQFVMPRALHDPCSHPAAKRRLCPACLCSFITVTSRVTHHPLQQRVTICPVSTDRLATTSFAIIGQQQTTIPGSK